MSEALGVRERGAPEGNQNRNGKEISKPSNDGIVPTAADHVVAIGVSRPTVERWEKGRKEILSDPDLS